MKWRNFAAGGWVMRVRGNGEKERDAPRGSGEKESKGSSQLEQQAKGHFRSGGV